MFVCVCVCSLPDIAEEIYRGAFLGRLTFQNFWQSPIGLPRDVATTPYTLLPYSASSSVIFSASSSLLVTAKVPESEGKRWRESEGERWRESVTLPQDPRPLAPKGRGGGGGGGGEEEGGGGVLEDGSGGGTGNCSGGGRRQEERREVGVGGGVGHGGQEAGRVGDATKGKVEGGSQQVLFASKNTADTAEVLVGSKDTALTLQNNFFSRTCSHGHVSSDDDDLDIKRQGVRLTQVLVGLDVKPVQGMRVCLSTEGLSAFDEVVLNISRKGLGRITKVMHSGIVA